MTNSSEDVWGGSYSYLVPVESWVDQNVKNYRVKTTMNASAVKKKAKSALGVTLSDDPEDWFEILSYTEGGYVDKIMVGNKKTTGRVVREQMLGLRSACFDIDYDYDTDKFTFITYGYGHGVG